MRQVYKWCENVFIVDGYLRSCVYDLQRSSYELVPKESAGLLAKIEGKTQEEIASVCTEEEVEWVDFFLANEYLLPVPESVYKQFPVTDSGFEIPAHVSNAIVDAAADLKKTIELLDSLGCRHIHLLVETDVQLEWILEVHFKTTNFQSVSATIDRLTNGNEVVQRICESYPILSTLMIKDEQTAIGKIKEVTILRYLQEQSEAPLFIVKYQTFFESGSRHLYFNKKVFIDAGGNIRNSPQCTTVAGNINQVESAEAFLTILRSNELTEHWAISKDQVVVCSDCEFRRMCFEKNSLRKLDNGMFRLEATCPYNPYIAKWKGEETYLDLQDCGVVIADEKHFVDHDKLQSINAELWGS